MGALRERNFRMDARIKSGHDEEKNERDSEAKRRQTQWSYSAVADGHGRACKRQAHIYRRSTAVLVPRSLSSQGTQHQACFLGLGGTRFAHPLSGRYPPLPVPVQRIFIAPRS